MSAHCASSSIIILLICCQLPAPLDGQDRQLTDAKRKELIAERDSWGQKTQQLQSEGKLAEAVQAGNRMLELERQLFPEAHEDIAGSHYVLAGLHERLENFDAARKYHTKLIEIRTKLNGKDHWRYRDAVANGQRTERFARLSAQQRKDLARAEDLGVQATELHNQGKFAEAVRAEKQVLEIRRRIVGEQDLLYAEGLAHLAATYRLLGNQQDEESVIRQALAIRGAKLGEQHPLYAQSLIDLGEYYEDRGDYRQAETYLSKALEVAKQANIKADPLYWPIYAMVLRSLGSLNQFQGKYKQAESLLEEACQTWKQYVGEEHGSYTNVLHALGVVYFMQADYTRAESTLSRAWEIQKKILGESHPHTAVTLTVLGLVYRERGQYPLAEETLLKAKELRKAAQGETHIGFANVLDDLAVLYLRKGDYAKSEPLFIQALEIKKNTVGTSHPVYLSCLSGFALLSREQGKYERAKTLFAEALATQEKVLGKSHENYATNLDNLAGVYASQGDYAKAEELYMQALDIKEKSIGVKHPTYATSLHNLATLYDRWGKYDAAEARIRQALEVTKESVGQSHPEYANCLGTLGELHASQGDYLRAEELFRQALAIQEQAVGKSHPHYAGTLLTLGQLYLGQKDFQRAEQYFLETLAIRKAALGESHLDYANVLNSLAMLYQGRDEYAKAVPLMERAAAVFKQVLGESHPSYATVVNNLGTLYHDLGDLRRADSMTRQGRDIIKRLYGTHHPQYALSSINLATLYRRQGRHAEAKPLFVESLRLYRDSLNLAASIQSERQQLAMLAKVRGALDKFISFALDQPESAGDVWAEVLAWKGLVLHRQRAIRALSASPELAPVAAELETVVSRLAILSFNSQGPSADERRTQLAELLAKKESLEQKLATGSKAYREANKPFSVTDVTNALPPDAALVDFFEHSYFVNGADGKGTGSRKETGLVAFVVRPGRPIVIVDLDASQPLVAASEEWRTDFGGSAAAQKAARTLREKLWLPVEKHLSNVKTVLVSPDGELGKLPLAALPGKSPDTYLIEDYRVAVLPAPQALAWFTEANQTPRPPGNVLAIGGVDYDRRNKSFPSGPRPKKQFTSRAIGESGRRFEPLPATTSELADIRKLYNENFGDQGLKILETAEATQDAFVREAPRHLYLHIATHGYFAAPKFKSALGADARELNAKSLAIGQRDALEGYHPGLLSGLALAGANQPTADDDGILTAEEVSTLNMNGVSLVVLSACETGLGLRAGGEGLLGLQRAFQVSGARTVIATLWKVDDAATRDLMQRFYDNLWSRDMSKLEALHEAQLWMLRDRGRRGLKEFGADAKATAAVAARLPPYYWAAFVMSGDWR